MEEILLKVEEVNEIFDEYKLKERAQKVIRLQAGWENNNYKIETDGKPYFLKEMISKTKDELQLVLNVVEELVEKSFPTPKPYKTANNESYLLYKEKKIILFDFLDGKSPSKVTPKMTYQIGNALGILHTLPAMKGKKPDYIMNINKIPNFLTDNQKMIDQDLYQFIDELYHKIIKATSNQKLKVGIIHGDLFIDNTLFQDENLLAIIDFEDVTEMEVVLDISMTILGCCYLENDFQKDCFQSFIKGYESQREIPKEEKELLPIYILYSMLVILVWRFKKWNLDLKSEQKLKERYKIMKRAIEKFINEKWV